MSQRISGYARKPDEAYETIAAWPVVALLSQLGPVRRAWDPCDRNSGRLVATLREQGVDAIGTSEDFLKLAAPPDGVSDLITNPPYGESRRGEMAESFIQRAHKLEAPRISMLLRNDFDSAIGRQHLFRFNPNFAGKIVLLGRIVWFKGPSLPSDNHAWFCWSRMHVGPPVIRYAYRDEAEARRKQQITVAVGLPFMPTSIPLE
jgi:hypothetical protein